jgi:hypothetical protein
VVQQIYFRFVNGQTSDPRFANLGERVAYLARRAAGGFRPFDRLRAGPS